METEHPFLKQQRIPSHESNIVLKWEERPECVLQFLELLAPLMETVGTLAHVLCYVQRCLLLALVHNWQKKLS